MSTKPIIGLTTYFTDAKWGIWEGEAAIVPAAYLEAVTRSGGIPLLIPPAADDPSVLHSVDGLVFLGGDDVDPDAYGAERHPKTVSDPRRDAQEFNLLRAALEKGAPTLAVCRGIQVLNVALGGTLHQHLPDVVGHSGHRPAPATFGEIDIETEPGSRIADVLGETSTVRCYHHQAIDRVAPGLTVTARSDDGLVQAVEPDGDAWMVGVQFHPEESPDDTRLFDAVVAAAREHSREAS